MATMYRQGDVLLVKVDYVPEIVRHGVEPQHKYRVVLAFGETTGHAHAIYPEVEVIDGEKVAKPLPARLWDAGAERFLQVMEKTALRHEEHGAIDLEPGIYKVVQQREYDPILHARSVVD